MDLIWLGSHFVYLIRVGELVDFFIRLGSHCTQDGSPTRDNRGTLALCISAAKIFAITVIERRRICVPYYFVLL